MEHNRTASARLGALSRPLSRLPMPGLRPSASRENMATAASAASSDARPARLRSSASREQLPAPSRVATGTPKTPSSAATSSHVSPPMPSTAKALPRPRPVSSLPTMPRLVRAPSNSGYARSRRETTMASLTEQSAHQKQDASSKLPGLRKKASAQGSVQANTPRKLTASLSRTSLTERTMETLAFLPSSATLKTSASHSDFLDSLEPYRPSSRAASAWAHRPGTSRRSESFHLSSSRPSSSRPCSRAGLGKDSSRLPTTESMPTRGRPTGRPTRMPSKVGLNGSLDPASASPSQSRVPAARTTTPSTDTPSLPAASPRAPSTALPTAEKRTTNGDSPKTFKPVHKAAAGRKGSITSQKSSTTASGEETMFSGSSSASTQTAGTGESSPQFKKSSTALRETIARAKAAKRVAGQRAPGNRQAPFEGRQNTPVIPTDSTFDFGLNDDAFPVQRNACSTTKVLQSRVSTARTSGRLNIAALGLKEIPSEVLNMYNLDFVTNSGGRWAESVDLTRFVAADNELEMIEEGLFPDVDPEQWAMEEDAPVCMFAGLETLDLHGNMLISLPMGLRRLAQLTSLNLSSNRLANNCLEPICRIAALRDLKLGGNLLWGQLEPCFSHLANLEILDLHGNNLQSLPSNFAELRRLRVLNIAENSFESLPFAMLSKLPLTQLNARSNKLSGVLIQDGVDVLPTLHSLDVSSNQLTALVRPYGTVDMPALTQLCVSMNRIQALPDISSWTELITLTADENSIHSFPAGLTELGKLTSIDFSSNEIRTVPAEVGRMSNLSTLRLSGNPLKDKKFISAPIDDIKDALVARLSPPLSAMGNYAHEEGLIAKAITSDECSPLGSAFERPRGNRRNYTHDYTTSPVSVTISPARKRSPSVAVAWEVKSGGVLDRSHTQSSSLHPVACCKIAYNDDIREVQLHHNLFSTLPESLTFFADTLTTLSLAHNQLIGETYLGGLEELDFPVLKELILSSNHITSLAPLVNRLFAPNLVKLDVSVNRVTSLPSRSTEETEGRVLRDAFPRLSVLLLANNHLVDLDPESIRGLHVFDATNNDIAHLNPRIGLMGGAGGLERLDVTGNRFRVPRWNVLERGTEATLRWLRGRVPVAEMAAWKVERGIVDEDVSDVD